MKQLWLSFFAVLLMVPACQNQHKTDETPHSEDSIVDTMLTEQVADSTIYGTSDEFGMSTFTLISDQGDTLYLTRTAEDGTDGKIYGDLKEGERYALTTRENNEAIGVLINLNQLQKHTKDYSIWNGKLIIKGDTVEIEELTDKELKIKQ